LVHDVLYRESPLNMKISSFVSALALGLFVSGSAFAKPDAGAKAAKSSECYKEADVKGLHGKERKKFHRECVKG